jgi:hypothetical protein
MFAQMTELVLEQKRTRGALETPPPALTTTRKDRAMATRFPTSKTVNHKGDQGELIASAWLLGLGYEVFRNVGSTGPADLVVWQPQSGEIHLIDVKHSAEGTLYSRADGSICVPLRADYREGIHRLLVVDAEVIGFLRLVGKSTEFYWPLGCPEIPVTLVPTAKGYKERPSHQKLLSRDQSSSWRRRTAR